MYAVLKHGGHQYRVAAGDRLLVDRISAEVGSTVTLEPVLLVAGDGPADIGSAGVVGARVTAVVVAHRRGRKIRVFTYKPKKRRRRTIGHRSQLTELRIEEVAGADGKPHRATAAAVSAPKAARPAAKAAAKTAAAVSDSDVGDAAGGGPDDAVGGAPRLRGHEGAEAVGSPKRRRGGVPAAAGPPSESKKSVAAKRASAPRKKAKDGA